VKYSMNGPLTVHRVPKVVACRAPELGAHNDELMRERGFRSRAGLARFRIYRTMRRACCESKALGGVR